MMSLAQQLAAANGTRLARCKQPKAQANDGSLTGAILGWFENHKVGTARQIAADLDLPVKRVATCLAYMKQTGRTNRLDTRVGGRWELA